MLKTVILAVSVTLSSLLFLSCASSERMARMSGGVFGKSSLPSYERIEGSRQKISSGVIERKKMEVTAKYDDTLVNVWPIFYQNSDYFSVLWPLADYDKFGFAIRPFFNKEGNEYSVLFPLTAWNPIKKNGWILNTYWTRRSIGSVPFFHYNSDNGNFYVLLGWKNRKEYGVFPLIWARRPNSNGKDGYFNVFPLYFQNDYRKFLFPCFYWSDNFKLLTLYYQDGKNVFGFAPIVHFNTEKEELKYVFPFWIWGKAFGLFPVARFNTEKNSLNYVLPFWMRGESFGLFPIFEQNNGNKSGHLFPLYSYDKDSFFSPLAGWKNSENEKGLSILGPVYLRIRENFKTPETDFVYTGNNENRREKVLKKSQNFNLYGILAYHNSKKLLKLEGEKTRRLYYNSDEAKRAELLKQAEEVKSVKCGVFPFFHREKNESASSGNVYRNVTVLTGFVSSYEYNGPDQHQFSVCGPLIYREEMSQKMNYREEKEKSLSRNIGLFYYSSEKEIERQEYGRNQKALVNFCDDLNEFETLPQKADKRMISRHANLQWRIDLRAKLLALPAVPKKEQETKKIAADLKKNLKVLKKTDFANVLFPFYFRYWKEKENKLFLPLLLSFWKETPEEQSFLNPFYADSRKTFCDPSPVDAIQIGWNSKSGLVESIDNTLLLGILYGYHKKTYAVMKNRKALSAYHAVCGLISVVEYKRVTRKGYESRLEPLQKAWKEYSGEKLPEPVTLSGLYEMKDSIFRKEVKNSSISRRGGMLLYGISRMEQDYDWDVLFYLARGSKTGDREQVRVLEWFYRSNTDGKRENTLIFPFISVQKEENRERCSFLWRLLSFEYENNKLSGGYLFFIPFK